jgi:ABC-type ATPase involved in cell division
LTKRFGERTVLDGVSFEVPPGEVVAVLGASGAGKTTLFRCLIGLAPTDGGEIFLGEQALSGRGDGKRCSTLGEVGLIFQQFNLVRRLSALDNVLAGRLGHVPTWRVMLRRFPREDRQLALAALDRVGLLPQALQRADSLSGGQQQRVAIARAGPAEPDRSGRRAGLEPRSRIRQKRSFHFACDRARAHDRRAGQPPSGRACDQIRRPGHRPARGAHDGGLAGGGLRRDRPTPPLRRLGRGISKKPPTTDSIDDGDHHGEQGLGARSVPFFSSP